MDGGAGVISGNLNAVAIAGWHRPDKGEVLQGHIHRVAVGVNTITIKGMRIDDNACFAGPVEDDIFGEVQCFGIIAVRYINGSPWRHGVNAVGNGGKRIEAVNHRSHSAPRTIEHIAKATAGKVIIHTHRIGCGSNERPLRLGVDFHTACGQRGCAR